MKKTFTRDEVETLCQLWRNLGREEQRIMGAAEIREAAPRARRAGRPAKKATKPAEQAPRVGTTGAVLEFAKMTPNPFGIGDAVKAGAGNYNSVYSALNSLVKSHALKRVKRGAYQINGAAA